MAIYHLEAKVVSRGAGRSAVAASAYLSCSRLYNDYDGIQHDYTKKQGLVWQQMFLPEYAPQEWQDREKLWNAVEEVETAKDSRLAREFVVALPIELNREQQIELLQDFIREQFVSDGMCADAAIHDTDGHNPHAHILLTVRPLDEQGRWQYKTEKEYLCMRNGEERGFTAAEFRAAQNEGWEKQYPYKVGKKKVYMTPSAAEAQGLIRAEKINHAVMTGTPEEVIELCRFIHIESCFDYVCDPPADFLEQCEKYWSGRHSFAGQSSARSATHGTPSKPSATEMSHHPKGKRLIFSDRGGGLLMTATHNYGNINISTPILSADPNVKEDVMTDQQKDYDTLLPPQQ